MKVLLIAVFTGCLAFIAYYPEQSDFILFFPFFVLSFSIYFYGAASIFKHFDFKTLFGLSVIVRIVLCFSLPNLSDDIYRYMWDGTLTAHGFNPYSARPAELINEFEAFPFLSNEFYSLLNSQEYFTIYPPLSQMIFAIPVFIGIDHIVGYSIFFKSFLCLFEIGNIFLLLSILNSLGQSPKKIFIYALNPLIIIEIAGNGHLEGIMIFFFLLFYSFLLRSKKRFLGITFACSIASKLLTAMFLPLMFKILKRKERLIFFSVLTTASVIMFLPIIFGFQFKNFATSLDLYFQKFEFNGSIYYLIRYFGHLITGYNQIRYIGPFLAVLSAAFMVIILYKHWKYFDVKTFPKYCLVIFTIYLLFATTVHPWYLCLPVALCVFTNLRYPLIWSFLILLTYVNYSYEPYFENLWFVFLEYSLLFLFILKEKGLAVFS